MRFVALLFFTIASIAQTIPPAAELDEPCGNSGPRVEVLYVQIVGHPDRFDMMRQIILNGAHNADAIFDKSAHKTGGHRHIRYLTTDDCEIAIERVQVAALQSGYIVEELAEQGYDQPGRKYLLFVDAFALGLSCGGAVMQPDDTSGSDNLNNATSYIHLYLGCWAGWAVAHELVHSFGGVQLSAPNSSGGNHCTDGVDIMCYSDAPFYPELRFICEGPALLDCGNDDYFHTDPLEGSYLAEHWNVADSVFLSDFERKTYFPMVMQ